MTQKTLIKTNKNKDIFKDIETKDINYDRYMDDTEDIIIQEGNQNTESFFKELVTSMNDEKNISMKTEYINIPENFNGVKLEFYGTYGNMPYLKSFVTMFEKKRVSLQRKGRKEDVMILQKREEEMAKERMNNFNNMFNLG